MKKYITILLICIWASNIEAQNNIEQLAQKYIDEYQSAFNPEEDEILAQHTREVIAYTLKQIKSTNEVEKIKNGLYLLKKASRSKYDGVNKDTILLKSLIMVYLQYCFNKSGDIRASAKSVLSVQDNWLFDADARKFMIKKINEQRKKDEYSLFNNIGIIGRFRLTEFIPPLRKILNETIIENEDFPMAGDDWLLSRLLARLGDKKALDYCIKTILPDLEVKGHGVKYKNALWQLEYIARAECVPIFMNELKKENEIILVGEYNRTPQSKSDCVSTYLIRIIENVPQDIPKMMYEEERIKAFKNWLNSQPINTLKIRDRED